MPMGPFALKQGRKSGSQRSLKSSSSGSFEQTPGEEERPPSAKTISLARAGSGTTDLHAPVRRPSLRLPASSGERSRTSSGSTEESVSREAAKLVEDAEKAFEEKQEEANHHVQEQRSADKEEADECTGSEVDALERAEASEPKAEEEVHLRPEIDDCSNLVMEQQAADGEEFHDATDFALEKFQKVAEVPEACLPNVGEPEEEAMPQGARSGWEVASGASTPRAASVADLHVATPCGSPKASLVEPDPPNSTEEQSADPLKRPSDQSEPLVLWQASDELPLRKRDRLWRCIGCFFS